MVAERPFYVGIPGVDFPVQAGVQLLYQSRYKVHTYAQDPVNGIALISDSRQINAVARALMLGRQEDYSSLLKYGINKKILDSGKVTEDQMRKRFEKFHVDFWEQENLVWAEFVDLTPEKRGHYLEKGKDIVLYRGEILVSERTLGVSLDVSKAEVVQVSLPLEISMPLSFRDRDITKDWREITDAFPFTDHTRDSDDIEFSMKNNDGVMALYWRFKHWGYNLGDMEFLRYGSPWSTNPHRGAVLGSRLSADEIVANFKPDGSS